MRCRKLGSDNRLAFSQDIQLAKNINVLSPDHQPADFALTHGADIILGGHDHFYYVSKGISSWDGYDAHDGALGAELDKGDVLVVKSGTDFRELSEVELELEDTPPGSVRRKIISNLRGKLLLSYPKNLTKTG